ncbi:lachesin-like isoform X3 [Pectinophora gossypiella]|uniref:lachesin-like isoform X3 n=1 Tax=Pectinophora gossypiella TaxID=13191 RepID=UPI00214E332E|nr:lachesin-like isoform X3 [Pectinophora gossypiella]
MNVIKFIVTSSLLCIVQCKDDPMFSGEGSNVTVVVGRDATLVCTVENLHSYKVAWLRVDTQTILTLGPHVITKNHRVGVARLDPQSWALTVRDVRPSDGGRYMCQINTEPMITQTHILQVSVGKWSGEWLNMTAVQRDMSGAYLCIATNGVPPSVSKRIMLHVLCKPSVRMSQKMIGGYVGETVTMLCKIETYPVPVVYWTHLEGRLHNGSKYQMSVSSKGYKHEASLRVTELSRDDIGPYSCHAENALGSAWDDITLYTLVTTTFTSTSVETTKHEVISTTVNPHTEKDEERTLKKDFFDEDNFVVVLSQHQMQNLDVSPTS